MTVTDNTMFPWGEYRGTAMANIPAQYLLDIFKVGVVEEGSNKHILGVEYIEYILENYEVLLYEINK